ncbi:MAG: hypothetical protein NW205_10600, partial [Hyphomicrobiaceae bacterium]|nr:hypothetical protein [Hyphomicrobiaceae bacterium]
YVREWPGLDPAGFLGDKFGDRIIAFNSAESGLGAWWYWIVKRAKHGPQLKKAGFGLNGKPTIAILARAVAGPSRSADYVRTIYLEPYRNFAEKYFGRRVGDDEPLPLDDPETRWNMGRMLLRLESGRDPVISRKQFDCGVAYGTDVMADFDRADVEAGGSTPIALTAFKGGAHYTVTCAGGQLAALDPAAAAGGVAVPPVVTPPASGAPAKPAAESPPVAKPPPAAGPAPPTAAPPATPEADTAVLARLSAEIEAAKATISQLRSAVANEARRADGADSARKAAESALNAARGTIADLERQIAARPPAVSPPPAATEPAPAATQSRLQSLERELSLMSELLGEVRARCKAEAALCKP